MGAGPSIKVQVVSNKDDCLFNINKIIKKLHTWSNTTRSAKLGEVSESVLLTIPIGEYISKNISSTGTANRLYAQQKNVVNEIKPFLFQYPPRKSASTYSFEHIKKILNVQLDDVDKLIRAVNIFITTLNETINHNDLILHTEFAKIIHANPRSEDTIIPSTLGLSKAEFYSMLEYLRKRDDGKRGGKVSVRTKATLYIVVGVLVLCLACVCGYYGMRKYLSHEWIGTAMIVSCIIFGSLGCFSTVAGIRMFIMKGIAPISAFQRNAEHKPHLKS